MASALTSRGPSVAVVGAGLAGLALAQSLARARVDVQVYESDPSPYARRQGYRITIDEHGAAALRFCLPANLFEAVLATASRAADVGYFRFTNQNLGEIFTLAFKRDSSRGSGMIGQVDRATLRTIMLSGLEEKVHFAKAVTRIEQAADSVILRFADGDSTRASVAVGADGTRSIFRRQLLPDCPELDTGSRGVYGKTPLMKEGKSLLPQFFENSGVMAIASEPGHCFFFTTMRFKEAPQRVFARFVPGVQVPESDDYVMWAITFLKQDLPADFLELESEGLHRLALDAAREYHPALRRFVENAEVEYTIATTLSAATKPKRWRASRATLVGDAVHVMPPTGAHGGNTALRDAALLAQKLQNAATSGNFEHAIGAYQREMLDYAFCEVKRSVAMLRRGNVRNPLARFLMLRAIPWLRSFGRAPLQMDA